MHHAVSSGPPEKCALPSAEGEWLPGIGCFLAFAVAVEPDSLGAFHEHAK